MDPIILFILPVAVGLIIALVLMKLLFGDAIRLYNLLGAIVDRVPHHNKDKNKIQTIRINEMKRIKDEKTKAYGPIDFIKFLPKISAVCGELKDLTWVIEGLKMGFKIDLIFGNKIWNIERKEELIELMNKYPDQLSVFSKSTRPDWHTQKINDMIVIEDLHSVEGSYDFATVIREAKKDVISDFDYRFDLFKTPEKTTVEQIRNLGTYN
ncbi:MAG: hypothetical protein M0Q91_11200 [Methanoregula sp.]|jgi:hypothetical protein|nr:hypothetical protein [Methanoregula sp.]